MSSGSSVVLTWMRKYPVCLCRRKMTCSTEKVPAESQSKCPASVPSPHLWRPWRSWPACTWCWWCRTETAGAPPRSPRPGWGCATCSWPGSWGRRLQYLTRNISTFITDSWRGLTGAKYQGTGLPVHGEIWQHHRASGFNCQSANNHRVMIYIPSPLSPSLPIDLME